MSRETTLITSESLLHKAAMVLGGSLFIAIAAQISVPMYPVPMTLQTLAILLVGLSFGSRLGALTVIAYLAEGAMGLPVFANAMNGAAFFGPTAGFLVGFVGLAWVAGFAVERGLAKGILGTAIAGIVASALLYIPGIAWPMSVAQLSGIEAGWIGREFGSYYWAYFMAPFLIGDAVKAVLAALIVTGGWKVLKR
ncbi:MAG: biotin transporter BioY [Paracoccaceae bacterium]|jgi:biotin transport system substrate-specific component|nr:biotin transporter BioY [Paracoccaceae bacterium]MDP7186575.1 biotin transporter BioY [Paracoccaceae bacterium]